MYSHLTKKGKEIINNQIAQIRIATINPQNYHLSVKTSAALYYIAAKIA